MFAGLSAVADEPLPLVKARSTAQVETPTGAAAGYDAVPMTTDTPTEPIRPLDSQIGPATLAQAVAANDYAAFERLYAQAADRGDDLSAYRDIHELWSYAQSDRIGAFYSDETHDRLARRYPQYRSYIEDYRVIDSRGRAYYPTAETRSFLLQQALAEVRPLRGTETRVASRSISSPVARRHRRMQLSSASTKAARPAPTHVQSVVAQATPPVIAAPPVRIAATIAPVTKPKPVAVLASAMTSPSAGAVVDALKADMQKVAQQPPVATATPAPASPQAAQSAPPAPARGLFLIILGLIGIGIMTIILRTPGEKPLALSLPGTQSAAAVEPTIVDAPPAIQPVQEAPPAEPVRIQPKQRGRRASGSRG